MGKASRVLVVDDSVGICKTMSMILRRHGFDAEYAEDGSSALDKLRQEPFDVVLLDIKLHGKDGVEINKSIQSAHPHAHVAMMTAFALEGKVKEALADGAEKIFYKPLDIDSVLQYIKAAVSIENKYC